MPILKPFADFKTCTRCLIELPIDQFHRNSNLINGHRAECKGCARIRSRNYYLKKFGAKRPKRPKKSRLPKKSQIPRGLGYWDKLSHSQKMAYYQPDNRRTQSTFDLQRQIDAMKAQQREHDEIIAALIERIECQPRRRKAA